MIFTSLDGICVLNVLVVNSTVLLISIWNLDMQFSLRMSLLYFMILMLPYLFTYLIFKNNKLYFQTYRQTQVIVCTKIQYFALLQCDCIQKIGFVSIWKNECPSFTN